MDTAHIQQHALNNSRASSETKSRKLIYFGTGLASTKDASSGIGFGAIGMILKSALEGKKHGTSEILHDIGSGYDLSREEEKRLTDEQMIIYDKVGDRLAKMEMEDGTTIKLTNQNWTKDGLHKDDMQEVEERLARVLKGTPNEKFMKYAVLQTTAVKNVIKNCAVSKVGWTPLGTTQELEEQEQKSRVDLIANGRINEYWFDAIMRHCYPDLHLDNAYIAGDVDCQTGFRRSPYTMTESETRPPINRPIREFFESTRLKKCKVALKDFSQKIVLPFEELYGDIPGGKTTFKQGADFDPKLQELTIKKLEEIQHLIVGI